MANLQLLFILVKKKCIYINWGRFSLAGLKKVTGMQRGKRSSYDFVVFKETHH